MALGQLSLALMLTHHVLRRRASSSAEEITQGALASWESKDQRKNETWDVKPPLAFQPPAQLTRASAEEQTTASLGAAMAQAFLSPVGKEAVA